MAPRPVLVLNGVCGVGKTTIAEAVSDLLNTRQIPHALIDLDALSKLFPRPDNDPFGTDTALHNLQTLLPNLGPRPLIVARVVETAAQMMALSQTLAPCTLTHVLLQAAPQTVHTRLAHREHGETLEWHRNRAAQLDVTLRSGPSPDLTLDTTDLIPHTAALALLRALNWPAQETP